MDVADLKSEAENGSVVAQSILGISYYYGQGDVSQDYKEAAHWLTLAADRGASRALYHLGLIYEQGLEVEIDLGKAFRLHLSAAQRGEVTAYIHVARMLRFGRGTPVDIDAACSWYAGVLDQAKKGWKFEYLDEVRDFLLANRNLSASNGPENEDNQ